MLHHISYLPITIISPNLVSLHTWYLTTPRIKRKYHIYACIVRQTRSRIFPYLVFTRYRIAIKYKHITPNLVSPYISYLIISHNTYLYIPTSNIFPHHVSPQISYLSIPCITPNLVSNDNLISRNILYDTTSRIFPYLVYPKISYLVIARISAHFVSHYNPLSKHISYDITSRIFPFLVITRYRIAIQCHI